MMNRKEIPNDNLLQNAFRVYEASDKSLELASERARNLFAENFNCEAPLPLSTLCITVLGQNFKPNRIPNVGTLQLRIFYDSIDVNLPLEQSLTIDNERYWERVFSSICKDKVLIKQKSKQKDISWKNECITLKYCDLLETTPYEFFIMEIMDEKSKKVAPFITELFIKKMQPKREESFKKTLGSSTDLSGYGSGSFSTETETEGQLGKKLDEEKEPSEVISDDRTEIEFDYPFQECHHVNLSVLRFLYNLTSLTVQFIPPPLGTNYHTRFFNCSYEDMYNLAEGVMELKTLKIFKIQKSRMDCIKVSILLNGLKNIYLEELVFYYCQLNDQCSLTLKDFLATTTTLKHLDLQGNYFRKAVIDVIADSLKKSHTRLEHLNLSHNPFSDPSLMHLIKSLERNQHLKVLHLSGIQTTVAGSGHLGTVLRKNSTLEEIHLIAVPINGFDVVRNLNRNQKIQEFLCQASGITLEEEFKIELLIKRNQYIKEYPYINDQTQTIAKIEKFLKEKKHPIYSKVMEEIERKKKCLENKRAHEEMLKRESGKIEDEEDTELPSEDYKFKIH